MGGDDMALTTTPLQQAVVAVEAVAAAAIDFGRMILCSFPKVVQIRRVQWCIARATIIGFD